MAKKLRWLLNTKVLMVLVSQLRDSWKAKREPRRMEKEMMRKAKIRPIQEARAGSVVREEPLP